MKLGKLLEGAEVRYSLGYRDVNILGVADDSRDVKPGSLFVAVRGTTSDGHRYLLDALERGAAAVAVEDASTVPPTWPRYIPVAVVSDTRHAVSSIACRFNHSASSRVRVVGVTGTNGKTTVSYFVRSILEAAGYPSGLMGTIAHDLGHRIAEARNTTPGPLEIHRLLSEMERKSVSFAVMEVSSHALDQSRVAHIPFSAGIFTNLTSDHMDYHKTRKEYMKAKGRLFESLGPDALAVLNGDDWASVVYSVNSRGRLVKYGRSRGCDLRYTVESSRLSGSDLALTWRGRPAGRIRVGLPGLHNAHNAAAAAAFGFGARIDPEIVASGIGNMSGVPGRLEEVHIDAPFQVFVDYAHTEHALEAVLTGLRSSHSGRILLVFGAGGDRDRGKRPRMGHVAGRLADHLWITSDNPRSEDPDKIIRQIERGIPLHAWYAVEPNRELAIFEAMAYAKPGDAVVVAGKGHETTQTIGNEVREFDDKHVVRRAWRALCGEALEPARPGGNALAGWAA
ncbi:MAG: UDP-N-acetylmuramoyl-L-alanyl-D-glutamate--2,6-diaminopimelate ligase [Planctomycetota bacterium]|jgi:UDP-N-acetylmuramoyl-L-alanyl-D-glutamate--2,6-diaminopimelate ligase